MSKAKQTAETVIHESALTRIEPMPMIPAEWNPPAKPSWDRARALVNDVRRSITAVIQLGAEINALKQQYEAQGQRTDINGNTSISANVVKGWNAQVEKELGISFMTAHRIIERAYSLVSMRQIEEGIPVTYEDKRTKKVRTLESTPELQEQAAKAIEAVVSGTVAAPRAWAGLVGEGSRVANQGGVSDRAEVNHGKNLERAITKLRNSFQQWKHIDANQRVNIEALWIDMLQYVPDTIRP